MDTFNPKQTLIEALRKQYQIELIRGPDIIALNSKAILYIRHNKNAGATKNVIGKFWFGITKSEFEKYSSQNFFIVCACVFRPDEIDYLIFPAAKFDEIRKDIPLRSGQWKFNLLKTNERRYLLQIPTKGKYDVTQFLNYFDFSPPEFRRTYLPDFGEFQPKVIKEEIVSTSKKPMPLEEELSTTARDSSNPKNFEFALAKFFTEIGLPCKRIGGPGETDILVLEPVRFVVDGKSTKADTKSAINFTRIKRHMKENNAEFMVIVSVGFDPAVGRDAEIEGAALVDTQTLITILRIHKEYVLSPFDYIEIFRQPGIITSEKISPLQQKIEHQNNILNKLMMLLKNLDFAPRNIDEIKGRIDLYCEQNQMSKIEREEIESLLFFLSHDLLRIVRQTDNRFSLRFTSVLSKERLKSVVRMLCGKPLEVG